MDLRTTDEREYLLWRTKAQDKFMERTTVVNFHHIEQLGPNDVYIGRAGKGFKGTYGNPFHGPNREDNIYRYKDWFYKQIEQPRFKELIERLRGKRLVCFCAPKWCHGDIIAYYLNDGG